MITGKPENMPAPLMANKVTAEVTTTTAPTDSALPAVLEERAKQLMECLATGEPMHKAIRLANLKMGQFHEIYSNRDWALKIDKACTAFKRFAGSAVLQETVARFLDGDTEEVVLQKTGEKVTRKTSLNPGIVKVLMAGLDPQFANNPAGAGGMGGGTHIHITNNLPAATIANISMGNEDVVSKMLRDSDSRIRNAKVVDVVDVKEEQK